MKNFDEDPGAVFKEALEDFSPPTFNKSDVMASRNMLANENILTSAMCKRSGIFTLNSPPSCHAPLGTMRPAKFKNTFSIHKKIE